MACVNSLGCNVNMQRQKIFENQGYYHIYNRGVAKQKIFSSPKDYERLFTTFAFYQERSPKTKLSLADKTELKIINLTAPKNPLVEILAYCFMPNHFHLLIKQLMDDGIFTFMRRTLDSYTKYYNTKHNRVGPLFQGRFQAVPVETDEQMLHLSRYIHLNPFTSKLTRDAAKYEWSSCQYYLNGDTVRLCHPKFILNLAGSKKEYGEFVNDYAEYIQSLEEINNLLLESE